MNLSLRLECYGLSVNQKSVFWLLIICLFMFPTFRHLFRKNKRTLFDSVSRAAVGV
jgi:hypothetical protein